jgi:hypothetical protein
MEFGMELLTIVLFALVPTVPLAILGWAFLNRSRRRRGATVTQGTAPETPFAAFSVVGLVLTVVAVFFLAITIAARLFV